MSTKRKKKIRKPSVKSNGKGMNKLGWGQKDRNYSTLKRIDESNNSLEQ